VFVCVRVNVCVHACMYMCVCVCPHENRCGFRVAPSGDICKSLGVTLGSDGWLTAQTDVNGSFCAGHDVLGAVSKEREREREREKERDTHIHIHTCETYVYMYMHVHIYICTCMYVCIYV